MSTRVAFTVRLPAELYHGIKVHAVEQGIDLQDAAEAAFEAFLSGGRIHAPKCPLCDASSEETTDARILITIYRKGSEPAKTAAKAMLRALAR